MNAITQKQFNEIKHKHNLFVVSFDKNKRVHTYGNLNMITAMKEILYRQSLGQETLLIEDLPCMELSWERKDYNKYVSMVGQYYQSIYKTCKNCSKPYNTKENLCPECIERQEMGDKDWFKK